MKKALVALVLVLAMLAVLAGCGNSVEFEARYILMDWSKNTAPGEVSQIRSKEQLSQYFDVNQDYAEYFDDEVSRYKEKFEEYTDEFFENKYLVIVENRRWITPYNVSKISEDGEFVIDYFVPKFIVDGSFFVDVVIELDKDFAPESFSVVFNETEEPSNYANDFSY